MKKIIVIISLAALLLGAAAAVGYSYLIKRPSGGLPGTTPAVSGQVIDAIDTGVAGANIHIKDHKARSGDAGRFEIPAMADGNHKIFVENDKASTSYVITFKGGKLSKLNGRPAKELLLSLPFFAEKPRMLPPVDAADLVTGDNGLKHVKNTLEIIWEGNVSSQERASVVAKAGGKISSELEEIDLTEITVPDGNLDEVRRKLEALPEVKSAGKNYAVSPMYQPTDPDWRNRDRSWWLRKIEAQQSWEVSAGGPDAMVAVIDEGFQLDHEDLDSVFMRNLATDYSSGDIGARPDHGTHVSGIIAMQANRAGLIGVAPKVKIMPMRVVTSRDIAQAILLASKTRHIWVVNLSMGFDWDKVDAERAAGGFAAATPEEKIAAVAEADASLVPAAQTAKRRGVVIVKAAGNSHGPATHSFLNTDAVITVANTRPNDRLSPSSNFGAPVTIAAPGHNIWSTVGGGAYDFKTGTSMASPVVAGTVAAMYAAYPLMKPDDVFKLIVKTGELTRIGVPRLNAWQAVLAASGQVGMKGKVIDEATGTPAIGAKVYPATLKKLAVTTLADGSFTLSAIPWDEEVLPQARHRIIVEMDGKKKSFKVKPLPEDKWVYRDVVFSLKGEPGETVSLGIHAEPEMSCEYPDPYYGTNSHRFTPRFLFGRDIPSKQAFSQLPVKQEATSPGDVVDIKISGALSAVAVGGKMKLEVTGTKVEKMEIFNIEEKLPIHMSLEAEIMKEGSKMQADDGRFFMRVTSLKMKPFRKFIRREENGKEIYGTCKFIYDAKTNPLYTNVDAGSVQVFSEKVAHGKR